MGTTRTAGARTDTARLRTDVDPGARDHSGATPRRPPGGGVDQPRRGDG